MFYHNMTEASRRRASEKSKMARELAKGSGAKITLPTPPWEDEKTETTPKLGENENENR